MLCSGVVDSKPWSGSEFELSTSPPLGMVLGEGFSMLKTRSADYRRDSLDERQIQIVGWGAPESSGPVQGTWARAAHRGCETAPTACFVSPFVSAAAVENYSRLGGPAAQAPPYEGTAHRGMPRALATKCASTIVPGAQRV